MIEKGKIEVDPATRNLKRQEYKPKKKEKKLL